MMKLWNDRRQCLHSFAALGALGSKSSRSGYKRRFIMTDLLSCRQCWVMKYNWVEQIEMIRNSRFGGNLKCNFGKMYFYSRNNLITFFSIVYCYIVYFLLVLARKSLFTIFFVFTSHKVFKISFIFVIFVVNW